MAKRYQSKKRGCAAPFLLFLFALIFGGLFLYWSNNTILVHEETISSPQLPAAFDGLRIAHLSDLHGKEFGSGNSLLLQVVENAQPDLIVITGDLIDQESQYDALPALMDRLTAIAPTYYVTGNHEWAVRKVNVLKDLLREHGVRVLSDEYELWTRDGATLAVAGVDDPNGPAGQKKPARNCAPKSTRITQSCCPTGTLWRNTPAGATIWSSAATATAALSASQFSTGA